MHLSHKYNRVSTCHPSHLLTSAVILSSSETSAPVMMYGTWPVASAAAPSSRTKAPLLPRAESTASCHPFPPGVTEAAPWLSRPPSRRERTARSASITWVGRNPTADLIGR